ncbi:MAG: phenylacetic acid degradation bifunctional protein PaaZ, partial [Pseudomonadota bacterium]
MAIQNVQSFVAGHWVDPNDAARTIQSAVSGETIARAGNDALDVAGMLDHARHVGGPALRKLGFHDRARMLKALATHLSAHKQVL